MKKKQIISNLALLLTAIIWGFAFVAQVSGTKYIGSFTMIGFRFAIGIIALLPVVLFFERGRREKAERAYTFKASVITGLVLFTAAALQQFGIAITVSAGISGFITGLYMIFVPIAYLLFFRRKTGIQVWIGAVFAVIGLVLLCYKPNEGFSFGWGEILLFIGSFFWTAHVMLVDHYGKKVRSLHYSWGQFAVCAVLGLIFAFIFEDISVTALWNARWELLYCGVMSSGIAYTLQVVGQKHADPAYAVILMSTETAFSAIGGAIFGVDNMSWIGYAGCVLMFVGVVFSQINIKRKNKATAEYNEVQK